MKKLLFYFTFTLLTVLDSTVSAQNNVYTSNTTSPMACDGYAFIDSNTVVNNTIWAGNGTVLQTGGTSLDSLCAGTYTLTYTDFLGTSVTVTFTIGSGTSNPCSGFTALVSTTDATTSSSCDGTADAFAYGGTAPYMYQWNTGATNVQQTNLCVGNYICYVTDANGCTATSSGDVYDASTNTIDSILIFTNNSFPGTNVIDSLTTVSIEDCSIDYSLVVSASITNSVPIGTDSLQVTWTLFAANGTIVSTYTVNYLLTNPAAGVFSATLIVFCSQKSTNYNTIEITDQVYLESAGVEENVEYTTTIVNPFNNEIQISFGSSVDASVVLMDMNGRILSENSIDNSNNLTIESSNLSQGTYLLQVNIAGKVNTYKLLK